MMIKNQIFKFRENAAPAGNPNPIRVRGAKKSKVLSIAGNGKAVRTANMI
jgi:hypothetical protein